MDNLQAIFCGGFFRAVSCEAVSPGILPQRRHLWAHPQEHFPRASSQNHFPDALSQGSLRCAFEQGFSNGFFYRCNFRAKFRIVGFPGPFRRVVFRALSRVKLFGAFFLEPPAFIFSHGRFPWALSLGLFWYALSWVSHLLNSFAAEVFMSSFAGAFFLHFFVEALLRNIFRRASSACSFASVLPWALSWGRLL